MSSGLVVRSVFWSECKKFPYRAAVVSSEDLMEFSDCDWCFSQSS